MRTLLLVGIAGIAALTADAAHANHGTETTRVERRVIVVDGTSQGDEAVYRNGDDRVLAESDYRGRWQGEWSGSWDDSRERYNGTYQGSYDRGHGDAGYDTPPPSHTRMRRHDRDEARHQRREVRYDERYNDDDLQRLCRRDNGVGGAAIGAVVGGVAGNRIAGRGNRTAGTLLGAAGGAIVGAVIDRAEDNGQCRDYWRRTDSDGSYRHREYRHDGGYAYQGGAYGGSNYEYESSYAQGGYYGGGVTTIVIPGAPTIIEETETTYETVTIAAPRARAAPRRVARRVAARPRPRCVCR